MPEYPGLPAYPHPAAELPKLDEAYPFALLQTTTSIKQTTISEKPYPIKGWFVYGSNLMKTMPDKQETIKALKNLDLVVAIDTMPVDFINYADVVLPECTYMERYDEFAVGKFKGMSEISIRQPAIEPLFESKPSWWMTKELGSKLGLSDFFPWKDGEEYLAKRCEAGGIDFAELKREGVIIKKGGNPYITADAQPEFGTPSGKIELYSKQLAEKGLDPVPQYTRHPVAPPGYFRLLFGRAPLHTFSRTTNNFMLTDLQKENYLWINAKEGKKWG